MASLGNHPNLNITQCGSGGVAHRFPQSPTPFNWRADPLIPSIRDYVKHHIFNYLTDKGATSGAGVFEQRISQLSVEFESRLFFTAVSKEDYLSRETFGERVSSLIQNKFYGIMPVQQRVTYSTPSVLPAFTAPPSQLLNAVPNSIAAPSTPLNLGSANYISGSQLSPDAIPLITGSQANDFPLGRKNTSQMTPADQVTPNAPFPVDGIPNSKCDDSNLTFSGSVLQYESENSFDSNSKIHHFPEDLPKAETSSVKRLSGQTFSQENNAFVAEPEISGPIPTSYKNSQISGGDNHIWILSCYVKYKHDPKTSSLGQVHFLQYVYANLCNNRRALEMLKSQMDHIDQCLLSHCQFCNPLLQYHNNTNGQLRSKRVNSRIYVQQTPFENTALINCSSVAPEICHTPSKLRKVEGAPFSSSLSPGDEQYSGDTELKVETDTPHTAYSASICDSKIDISGEEQRFSSENASSPSVSDEHKDKALESSSSPSSKCLTILSEHQCTSQANGLDRSLGTHLHTESLEKIGAVGTCSASIKLKMQGVSLTEFFTPEEVKQHVWSLKQNTDQIVDEQEIGNTMNSRNSENICQLCNMEKLWFPPMPIYCSPCGSRIKCRGTYYSMLDENSGQVCFCSACYNKSRGPNKSKMEMKKNDVVTEESWVQCDKCEGWQHQICALFNDKRDLGGKTEYVCPNCYLAELETGDCKPLPWSSCFGASNLPRTVLSDHLEQRLFERLEKDREDRVKAAAEVPQEVLGASDLTVRVVSSVNKVLQVKQQFQDIFPDNSYPAEFPYRSKVILLFQRIEGVDVCLFGMYVQEFGSQCSLPNQRCIYISYLDSVKYFRPEAKSIAGEALRTFVYHEILIGYLEYCKKRGFSTCYIWACPPVKGEDYILYCHPEVQKTPKPDKLRQWYRSMLKKAAKEQIIVNSSNIYEQFFVHNEGCNTKVTAARLPYFDGDYWSSVADSMIKKIEKECGGDLQKKVKKMTRRSLKAMGHTDPTVTEGDAKDILLMHELGQTLSSAKEDFIIVYLQYICTSCHEVIASGKRWYCSHCKNFQLCEVCHGEDHNPENTHISSSGQKHVLSQEVVENVPSDTEDNDAIMNNCFLENRHALLSFCQGNHYQFDTLRRAKHSSMMILYHLHHPNSRAEAGDTTTTCSLCLKDVAVDRQWKCNLCPDFVVCGACYQRNGIGCHTHNLIQTKVEKPNMIDELLDVLLHASKCCATSVQCDYPNCMKIRRLFSHTRVCKTRAGGGCSYCKKAWQVIRVHAARCRDQNCGVPRCRDVRGVSITKPPDTAPEPMQ